MRNFNYVRASDPSEASAILAATSGRIIAGGTDLLPLMKDDLAAPDTLVDISQWREGREIRTSDNSVQVGALVTLSELAAHPVIRERYTALAEACSLSAAPQLRNMGTLGGNLLQATRCWYYRGPYNCWLKGGDACFARNGENELHSIFHASPHESMCVSASPSDPATALLALDATVSYMTTEGSAEVSLTDFFQLPAPGKRTTISIPSEAIITSINLPAFRGQSHYRTIMSRTTWTFALAGVAIAIQTESRVITKAYVAVGGVAPIPIRITTVEQALTGKKLSELSLDELSQTLVETAHPLANNGYKVTLLAGLFRETLAGLS